MQKITELRVAVHPSSMERLASTPGNLVHALYEPHPDMLMTLTSRFSVSEIAEMMKPLVGVTMCVCDRCIRIKELQLECLGEKYCSECADETNNG